ncbi:FtsB family cell division protein [Occallatibacter savannae]|uniref:FtsB family cell division protein n=1 Tax=Occallatibacter savannae TaxID=1002691 RepID=UPI000D6863E6|nr:septum formation initiator family protein [Occallatibacter savannae]
MQHPNLFTPKKEAATEPLPLSQRAAAWLQQGWRPAGTVFAVALALAFAWSVVNGRHGLSTWYGQRSQEKQLKNEIQQLQDENARLKQHVDRLKSDPDAIEHEAREKLHYARPGEVIYSLPPDVKQKPATPGQER